MDWLILVSVAVVLLTIYALQNHLVRRKVNSIPGLEPSDKESGNLGELSRAGSLHDFLAGLHKKYGPIASFWMGRLKVISTASPALFKQYEQVFDRPPQLFKLFEPVIGNQCIQYANGADGKARRKRYDPFFSHRAICENIAVFQKHTNELAAKWAKAPAAEHIPIMHECIAFTFQSFIIASYGDLFKKNTDFEALKNTCEFLWSELEDRSSGNTPVPGSSQDMKLKQGIEKFKEIMMEAVKRRKEAPPVCEDEKLLIDTILESGFDDEQARQDWAVFLISGFHASGLLLTWCLYFLASNPDVQEKLYTELKEVLGDEPLAPSAVGKLKYTRQVLDETLRCSVLATTTSRYRDMDTELAGFPIPKNTPVIQAIGIVMMDENIWPNPQKFDPERFCDENKRKRPPHSFEPFGFAGKRKCPGYRFSYIEVTVALAVMVRTFKFHLVEGQTIEHTYGVVTRPKEEIYVTLEKRT